MTLYLSHPHRRPNDWWIVRETYDWSVENQVRDLVRGGRRVIAIQIDPIYSTSYEVHPANIEAEFA